MLTFATKVGDSYKPSNARTVGRTALNFLTSAGSSFSLFGLAPSFLTAEQAKQCSANPANISEDFDEKEELPVPRLPYTFIPNRELVSLGHEAVDKATKRHDRAYERQEDYSKELNAAWKVLLSALDPDQRTEMFAGKPEISRNYRELGDMFFSYLFKNQERQLDAIEAEIEKPIPDDKSAVVHEAHFQALYDELDAITKETTSELIRTRKLQKSLDERIGLHGTMKESFERFKEKIIIDGREVLSITRVEFLAYLKRHEALHPHAATATAANTLESINAVKQKKQRKAAREASAPKGEEDPKQMELFQAAFDRLPDNPDREIFRSMLVTSNEYFKTNPPRQQLSNKSVTGRSMTYCEFCKANRQHSAALCFKNPANAGK